MSNKNFEELMKTTKEDNKTFVEIIKSLGILQKKDSMPVYSTQAIQESTSTKFPRYKRDLDKRSVDLTANTTLTGKYSLRDSVNKFSRGYLDVSDFERILKEKNINPNTQEINKCIKDAKHGGVNHKELMFSVLRYKDS